MADLTVKLTVNTRYAKAWVRTIALLAYVLVPVVGYDRTMRLAGWGAVRFLRIKVGG